MASVDLNSALDLYAERGDWDRALETAAEHGNDVLHKYVALCATQRIREGRASDALQVISQIDQTLASWGTDLRLVDESKSS